MNTNHVFCRIDAFKSILLKFVLFTLFVCTMLTLASKSVAATIDFDAPVAASPVIVDDYAGTNKPNEPWYYSRIGTDRGELGAPDSRGILSYSVRLGNGPAKVSVHTKPEGSLPLATSTGWAGVWTRLEQSSNKLLGPYVKDSYQTSVQSVSVNLLSTEGYGRLKVELKDKNGQQIALKNNTYDFSPSTSPKTLTFELADSTVDRPLGELVWIVEHRRYTSGQYQGYVISNDASATIRQISFNVNGTFNNRKEAAFLYSFAHLSQAYDAGEGIVGDRARWPAKHLTALQSTGTFALVTAIANQLGFVENAVAKQIVDNISQRFASLSQITEGQGAQYPSVVTNGVFAHFVSKMARNENGGLVELSPGNYQEIDNYYNLAEYSTVDTVIALFSVILAREHFSLETDSFVSMLKDDIDWNQLLDADGQISHGYSVNGDLLNSAWDTFGSESFMIALAYAAADSKVVHLNYPKGLDSTGQGGTADGSGFNDEMAALFFPMIGIDHAEWGQNNWTLHRNLAHAKQQSYFSNDSSVPYSNLGIFGLSAVELPTPWLIDGDIYSANGTGGQFSGAKDGSELLPYPVIAPHYAALVAKEDPYVFEYVFKHLMNDGFFSPLNNTESFYIDDANVTHWSGLKGTWNLSLQALGIARALSSGCNENEYLPYKMLRQNSFLLNGFNRIFKTDYGCGQWGQAPIADAGADVSASVGSTVTLNGENSYDAGGSALTYAWTLNTPDGSSAALSSHTSATPSFTADVAGTYSATLVVSDGLQNSAPDSVTINIQKKKGGGKGGDGGKGGGGKDKCTGRNKC